MKKRTIAVVALAISIGYGLGYWHGQSRGRASGFDGGVAWSEQSLAVCVGMDSMRRLRCLHEGNYDEVLRMADRDLDAVVVRIPDAEEALANACLSSSARAIERAGGICYLSEDGTRLEKIEAYQRIADFRKDHPSPSGDQATLDAVRSFVEEYSSRAQQGDAGDDT